MPPWQLAGLTKVHLDPGESGEVTFHLGRRALAHWDVEAHGWAVEGGTYRLAVGSSSRDLHLQAMLYVPAAPAGDPGP